jgi:peptidoglycan/xylan/chitin deacetylase (PgdA/CDA1 family)
MSGHLATPVPVVLYHSVSGHAAPSYTPWNTTPTQLADHLDMMLDRGFAPVPLSALAAAIANAMPLPERPFVVTFDDGLADFADGALPVLADRNIPATLFVTTAFVGRTSEWLSPLGEGQRPMLSWSQLRELVNEGITIGSHGRTHRPLDELPAHEVVMEVATSRAELEHELQTPVDLFAYPHGYHSDAIKAVVARSGYAASCAVRNAISSTIDDVMALSRVMIEQPCSVGDLERLIGLGGLPTAPFPELLRTKLWRSFRRMRTRVSGTVGA